MKLFISHVKRDGRLALQLAAALENAGYGTWCYEIDNGGDFLRGIDEAIQEAEGLVVLVSDRSLARRDQVGNEISWARAARKFFVPVQCGVSDDDWDQAVPDIWRAAFAQAVRVTLDGFEHLPNTIVDMQRVLRRYNVQPAPVDYKRVLELENAIKRLPPTSIWERIVWRVRGLPSPIGRPWVAAALLVLLVIVAASLKPVIFPKRQVWITDLDGTHTEKTYDEVKWSIWSALSNMSVETADDKAVAAARRRCISSENPTVECDDRRVMEILNIQSKAVPTYRQRQEEWALALRIGDGITFKCVDGDPPRDENTHAIAIWGSERIASCIGVWRSTIEKGLAPLRAQYSKYEKSYVSTEDPGPPSASWSLSFDRSALALDCPQPGGDDIDHVLSALAAALESKQSECVLGLYKSPTDLQKRGLEEFFGSVDQLKVRISSAPEDKKPNGDTIEATFLRRDEFTDVATNRTVRIAVRLVATMSRDVDNRWKIQSLRKAT